MDLSRRYPGMHWRNPMGSVQLTKRTNRMKKYAKKNKSSNNNHRLTIQYYLKFKRILIQVYFVLLLLFSHQLSVPIENMEKGNASQAKTALLQGLNEDCLQLFLVWKILWNMVVKGVGYLITDWCYDFYDWDNFIKKMKSMVNFKEDYWDSSHLWLCQGP